MATDAVVERSTEEATVIDGIVSAVAATKGTDPMDLDPLFEVIDPDALTALYGRNGRGQARTPERVEFIYSGCRVVIAGDGSVTVSEVAPEELG